MKKSIKEGKFLLLIQFWVLLSFLAKPQSALMIKHEKLDDVIHKEIKEIFLKMNVNYDFFEVNLLFLNFRTSISSAKFHRKKTFQTISESTSK
jgi:hypothetical protein